MPYSVLLTGRDGGPISTNFKIYAGPTPSRGDLIAVDTEGETVKACVTAVVFAVPIDHVSATEI
jgi:hypothetical protein